MRANGDVKVFYQLAEELDEAVSAACAQLVADGLASEAEALQHSGPRQVAELARSMAQRIDLPLPTKQLAKTLSTKAQALNPGEREQPPTGRGRAGVGVEGWWSIPPKCESGAGSRAAL